MFEFTIPPSVGSPRFARGTAWGAWVLSLHEGNRVGARFPLLAGGTLRRGSRSPAQSVLLLLPFVLLLEGLHDGGVGEGSCVAECAPFGDVA